MTQSEGPDVFVHPLALCESREIGAGSRIWAFAHVLPGARIGRDCNICDGVFIENDVTVGDRVTVKCGVQLWDGVRLEDDVFVGPNATFTNDPFPRSKIYPTRFAPTIVRRGASIGANATILPGIEIGQGAMVAAGAVVTASVPANAIVMGNPARIAGYVDTAELPVTMTQTSELTQRDKSSSSRLGVGGAMVHDLRRYEDLRGLLSVAEFAHEIPFIPQRYFVTYDVPSKEVRGQHAMRTCHQFLICVAGSVLIMLDDGDKRCEMALDRRDRGIYVPPMVWQTHFRYSENAALLVFASHPYDPNDYIRNYPLYLQSIASQGYAA